jgi:hypothetical protein
MRTDFITNFFNIDEVTLMRLRLNFTESYSAAITKAAATLRKKKERRKRKKKQKRLVDYLFDKTSSEFLF